VLVARKLRIVHASVFGNNNRLRREQEILRDDDVTILFRFADPAVDGLLRRCKRVRLPRPVTAYDLRDTRGTPIAHLELAWPRQQVGVAIAADARKQANTLSWRTLSLREALDENSPLSDLLQDNSFP
jgi:hypothetical protein